MPILHTRVPDVQQQDTYPLSLPAGPAAAAAATERACGALVRKSKVIACHIFPDGDIVLNGGSPSVLTLQVGATVIGTASNAAAGITAAAGIALTLDAAEVDLSAGDVLKLVVTNPDGGAVDLSTTALVGHFTVEPR